MIIFYVALGVVFVIGVMFGYLVGYTQVPEKVVFTHDVPVNWPDASPREIVEEIQRLRAERMFVQADKMRRLLVERGLRVEYKRGGDIFLWERVECVDGHRYWDLKAFPNPKKVKK